MATITLNISDLDLGEGTYKIDIKAEGHEIDEGQATAAYYTGFFLNTIINTPGFMKGAGEFGQKLIAKMIEDGDRPATMEPAVMTLTLTDKNLTTGRYSATLLCTGGDPTGESLPTTAQVVGNYMRALLYDAAFCNDAWAFAQEFARNNGGEILNEEYAPNNDDEARDTRAA